MTIEQAIVEKLRLLPVEKQQEVLDFGVPPAQKRAQTTAPQSQRAVGRSQNRHYRGRHCRSAARNVGKLSPGHRVMSAVVADTHIAIWYLATPDRLSPDALAALDEADATAAPIYMASISVVEVAYLIEKGRLPEVVF